SVRVWPACRPSRVASPAGWWCPPASRSITCRPAGRGGGRCAAAIWWTRWAGARWRSTRTDRSARSSRPSCSERSWTRAGRKRAGRPGDLRSSEVDGSVVVAVRFGVQIGEPFVRIEVDQTVRRVRFLPYRHALLRDGERDLGHRAYVRRELGHQVEVGQQAGPARVVDMVELGPQRVGLFFEVLGRVGEGQLLVADLLV